MNSTFTQSVKTALVLTLFLCAGSTIAQVIYVSPTGNDANIGDSWGQSFATLTKALDEAGSGDEIWVAEGTYYPTDNPTDRDATFQLISGVAIYGGFVGTESNLSERNWENNETILSGDINQSGVHDGNSYSVVDGSGVDQTAVLDGFTITMGNADGSDGGYGAPNRAGAGIFINDGSPTLNNLKVQQNWASNTDNNGGGMHVNGFFSEPVISNSLFSENDGYFGGAIYLYDYGQLTINNCTIIDNTGGGIYSYFNTYMEISNSLFEGNSGGSALTARQNSTAHINNSSFIGNAGGQVGAVFNWDSQIYVENSIFSGNTTDNSGGAVYNSGPSVFEARNSLFFGNTAGNEGGAIYRVNTTTVKLMNSVISGNSAGNLGGGIANPDNNGSIEIINSIVWNNRANNQTNTISASIFNNDPVNISISFSLIANSGGSGNWNSSIGVDLGANIDLDPSFEEDVDLDNLPTSDGDLRLTDCSPAIDAGNPDTTGLNLPALDLDGNPRLFNATGSGTYLIDMGAYEFQSTLPDPDIIYVNATLPNSGNGISWECAFTSLQDALAIAQAGDTIWVAAGTYLPTTDELDRDASFFLANGVAIYGGFAGGETELSQRNIEDNETILSGDINDSGDHDGNSYSVVNGSGVDQTAVLDGFTIKLGNADVSVGGTDLPDRSGAGIYISNGSPSLNQLIVEENITLGGGNRGGGIYVNGNSAHPIIENSIIRNNQGSEGGGINVRGDGNLTILNSEIIQNSGGGIFVQQNVSIFISGCLLEGNMDRALTVYQNSFAQIEHTSFIGNSGAFAGGAIINYSSEILVTDCIFSGNTASSTAGAIYNGDHASWGSPSFEARNSLFFGNVAGSSVGGAFNNLYDAEVRLINCVLSGNSAGGQGGGMHNTDDANVELINTIVWNNRSSGQTNTTDASITTTGNAVSNISFSLIANSGGSGNWNSNIGTDLGDNIDLNPNFEEDVDLGNLPTSDGDLRLTNCSPAIDAGNPDTTGLNLPEFDLDGNARIFNATGIPGDVIDMGAYEFQSTVPVDRPKTLYVNADNPTPGKGRSWDCAFSDLQLALAVAEAGDSIWVAAGTYLPTTNELDRDASFFLINEVAIYGGFSGGETSLVQRDWENNETILSGDINQTGDQDGNSYTVVNGSNTNNSAVLDGFTIIMGNANFGSGSDSNPNRSGGGLYNSNGSPTIANCYITGNFAVQDGAGIYNINSASPTLNNCVISNNTADDDGGGIYNENNSSPAISDCIITGNMGAGWGGGIRNENNSSPTITNSIISGNQAFIGGGILNWGESSPSIINSTISGNEADFLGGGIYNFASSNPSVINSTISGNKADADGGGIYNESESNPIIINSIIWNNSANGLTSSVSASVWNENLSNPQISYSIIANSGGSSSWDTNTGNDLGSNIDLDPLFVEDVDLGNLPTSDGNFRITTCSPAIDAGNPDTTGLNLPDLDLDGNSRIFNATGSGTDLIDMGAYEFQSTVPVDRPNTLYVNADNPTPGKGRSWDCAFSDLQLALAVAEAGDSIWVAAGTYLPTPGSDRNISFLLKNGVSIYGGFTGTETQLDQRDWENNATILSGDIGVQGDAADNSFHVLRAGNGVTEALLDGFTVTGGNANGGGSNEQGAGMRIFGGASVDVANCRFENNFAEDRGAGIKVLEATANIRNSLFENNSSDIGAGILVNTSSVVNLEYCIFRNNDAVVRGGGVFYNSSSGEMRNCLFYDNFAGTEGGAIMMAVGATVNIINSTIANNDAPTGGGIFPPGSTATVANSIFWNNNQQFGQGGNINATYSILEGTYSGTGIISSDPLFTDLGNGDYSLLQCSPAIDAGNNNVVDPSDTLDLAGNLRLFDATELGSPTVDIGAYEYQDVVPATGNLNVIYVDASNKSAGSGVSWACAFTDLQDALAVAEAGDTIWVAQGIYRPTSGLDREIQFELKEGVAVLGGFDGTENDVSQRDWENNETILDGDINESNNSINNSYLIVLANQVDSTAVLDGFTIQGGNNPGGSSIGGGGISIQDGSPVIRNCRLVNNQTSFEGGGIFIINSSPSIVNCTITGNIVGEGGWGAGVFSLESNPTFVDCHFEDNIAFYGSGIYSIESNILIKNTTFTQNHANENGGALYLEEFSEVFVSNSTFSDNSSGTGGAIYCFQSYIDIVGSTFTGNSANFDGGAITIELAIDTMWIDSTLFSNNSAENGGAIALIDMGFVDATNCDFIENTASGFGGGIYAMDSSSVGLFNCTFDQNSAESGGGMKVLESTATIKNSIFHSNTTDIEGGAIMTASASLLMINSTIADNSSPAGGGLRSLGGSSTIANSIFWGNVEQINSNGSSITASQSIVEGGFAGAGIMTADPLFSDSDANDYSLQACSPAIDAGDNVFLSASDTLDLAGNPRIFNATGISTATVDIGAFEFQGSADSIGNSNVIYVDIDNPSPGAGTSWNCSFDDLQDALAIAEEGDTIWVAEGVYRPNLSSDQEVSFELKSGVVILGGFSGTETDLSGRDWVMYPTVLDGDVNLSGGSLGNSYQIVRAVDVDSTAVLDGFTIQGGVAVGFDQSSGGGIYIENASPILRNLIIQNCFGFSGGGAWVGDSSSAVFYNCTFIENNVSEGSPGGGALVTNSTAEFLNCTFTDNNAFFGGAIANLGSSILVDSSIFSINSSAMNGAGVFNDNSAQLFIYDSEFNDNSAFQRGGALYFSNNSSGVIEDCSFFDNSASVDGGAVFSNQFSDVHLSGSDFQENSAEFGGAISTQSGAITHVNNCFFQGNSSTSVGGAILSQNPFTNTSIDSSEFTGNYAVGAGGALAILNEATADCDNSVFEENNSEANGGAIVFWNQSFGTVHNSHFQFNSAEGTGGAINISSTNFASHVVNSSFTDNESLVNGGAIFSSASNLVLLGAELSGNLAIDGAGLYFSGDSLFVDSTLFSMNGATGNGGGLFFGGHFGQLDETIFTENTADIGGGIYNVGDFLNVFNSDIMENSAIKEGGGVYAEDSHTKMKKSKIDKNQAEMGGGFYGKKGELKKEKSKIRENLADKGAGVYFMKGKFDMDSVEISDNIAQQKGGGFYSDSTEVSFENSQIKKNQAMQEGGGFYKFKGDMMMKDTDLEDNEAMKGGGGYKKQAKAYFEKTKFLKNAAGEDGGGIYSDDGELKTKESIFEENHAGKYGGGIKSKKSKIEIDETELKKNLAMKKGGGMKNSNPKLDSWIQKSLFKENMAKEKGGGMASDSCDMSITDTEFSENEAMKGGNISKKESYSFYKKVKILKGKAVKGGGIYMEKGAPTLDSVEIKDNVALNEGNYFMGLPSRSSGSFLDGKGGGIFGLDSRPQLINLTISNNFSDDKGGGFYAEEGEMEFKNTDIEDNQSREGGGGFGRKGMLMFENSRIKKNTADEDGGGIYSDDGDFKSKQSLFEENMAGRDGGGIKSKNSKIEIEESEIKKNMAMREGGGLRNFSPKANSRIEKSMLRENLAMEKGGGMATDSCEMIVKETEFTENESKRGGNIFKKESKTEYEDVDITKGKAAEGGGIYMEKGSPKLNNVRIKENLALKENNLFGGTQSRAGASFLDGKGGGIFGLDSRPQLINLTISNNFSEDKGGGFYAEEGEMEFKNTDIEDNQSREGGGGFGRKGMLMFENSRVKKNTADEDGGGIYSDDGDFKSKQSLFEENMAGRDGGGIKSKKSKIEIEESEIKKNMAMREGGGLRNFSPKANSRIEKSMLRENMAMEKGGGMATDSCEMIVKETEFTENESKRGGNIFKKESKTEYEDVDITKGKAAEGGGIYMEKGTPKFKKVRIRENLALKENNLFGGTQARSGANFLDGKGGGIFGLDSRPQLINLSMSNNFSEDQGGGFYLEDGEMDLDSSVVENNESMEGGGGFSNSGGVNFRNSRLCSNNANSDGGGLFSSNGDVKFKDSEVTNNSSGKDGGGMNTKKSKIDFENVTFGGNTATQSGGGIKKMAPDSGSRFDRVRVLGNSAGGKGGGMASDSSDMQISNSIFGSNIGKEGGNVYKKSGNGRYKNVRIQGGKAVRGGGIYMENCSTEMVNIQVTGNVAQNESNFNGGGPPSNGSSFLDGSGGGMFNLDSRPQLINLSISGNYADDSGGGMMNSNGSDADIRNTILHNNQTGNLTDSLESGIMNENSMPTFNNSVVQGSNGPGGWNPNAGQDNGNNFDFNPQFSNPLNPSHEPSVGGNFRLGGNSDAIDSGNDEDVPPDVETDIVGNNRKSEFGVDIGAYERQPCLFDSTNTIYVNANRSDSVGDGTSWATAFNLLFDALFYAADCDSTFFIYIAEGTYFPTDDPTDRHTSVVLRDNLNILGGFPGTGNPTLDDRDWRTYETIISGDINSSGNLEGNSYSVVAAYDTDSTASLSGVVIRGGNANGNNGFILSPVRSGSGIYLANSNVRLYDIRLEGNSADFGAGMALVGESSPEMDRVEFSDNTAQLFGGGLADYSTGSDSVLWTNMLFHDNSALMGGGGILLENSRKSVLANLTLTENSSGGSGGAIQNTNSNTQLINSILWNNSSEIYNSDSLLSVSFSIVGQENGLYPGAENLNVNPNFVDPDGKDFSLQDCSPAVNAGDGTGLPPFDLLGNVRPANANFDLGAYEFQNTPGSICCPDGNVVFVNQNASGVNNGSDWFNAFADLQDALSLDCPDVTEIWVAQGTYYPDRGTQDRDSSFVMRNGISIIGGFDGTESEISERDWENNSTILSGDINDSDSLDGNSYSVVTAIETDLSAVLDGLIIKMGNASGSGPDSSSLRSGGGIYVLQGSITLVNSTVKGNYADFAGGGMYNHQSESEITNTTFYSNEAGNSGGAISNYFHSSPLIAECVFHENKASEGGAVSNMEHSAPTIDRSVFQGNTALIYGGALDNTNSSSPDVMNSLLSGNAAEYGGAMANRQGSSPLIEGVTIAGNLATETGGGVFNNTSGNPIIRNTIIWENLAQNPGDSTESSIKNEMYSNPEFFFSLIQYSSGSITGWNGSIGMDGGSNINVDPEFVENVNPSDAPVVSGNFLLTSCSPAINAGDTAFVSTEGVFDLAGSPRVNSDTIDLGAYEYFGPDCGLECPEGSIVYVVEGGSGAENGGSWGDALGSLQNALEIACSCLNIEEVWVAEGAYLPDNGRLVTTGDRNASFELCNEVALIGGFMPGDTSISQRNWMTNETILSGDINNPADPGDNSYTVVVGSETDSTAIIDGFTISGGYGGSTGGGMFNNNGSPTIENCLFLNNQAISGGGLYNEMNSSPTIVNSTFENNSATDGGGIYNSDNSSPVILNSKIRGNHADNSGGGLHNYSASSPQIVNSVLSGNQAQQTGGSISNNQNSSPLILNSTLSGNEAEASDGGAIFNLNQSFPQVINSIVWNNRAGGLTSTADASINAVTTDTVIFTNSLVGNSGGSQEWSSHFGADGGNNLDSDPVFAADVSLVNLPNTTGDLSLEECSPAIDVGANELFTYPGAVDIEGNPRIVNSTGGSEDIIDLGAFEFQSDAIVPEITCNSIEVFLDESGEVVVAIADLYNKSDSCGNLILLSDSVISYQYICDDLGSNPFFIQIRDEVSLREAQCSGVITVSDTLDPVLTCPVSDTVYVAQGCNVVNLNYGSTVDIVSNCPVTVSQTPYWGQVLAPSQYTQTVTAVDASGNSGSCSFNLFVLDTISPAIECPEDKILFVDGDCSAEIDDYSTSAIVSDNCGVLVVDQLPAAGEVLTVGDSVTANLTVTDVNGNNSSCTFEIVAIDTMTPQLTCLETEIVRYVDENCISVLGDIRHLAQPSDNCISSFDISQSADFELELGSDDLVEVTINVTAATGWTSSCVVNVVSIDSISPVLSCDTSSVILYVDESCVSSAPDFSDKTEVTDNCLQPSDFTIEQSILPGSVLQAGTVSEVELTASNDEGWMESCTFELTVTDTSDPIIQCIDTTLVLIVDESCTVAIGDRTSLADALDNCLEEGVFSVDQSLSSDFKIGAGEEIALTLYVSEASGWIDSCSVEISAVNTSEYLWISDLPGNLMLECDQTFEAEELMVADFCDTQEIQPQVDSVFGCMGLAELTISWSFQTLEHTQVVTFSDESAPEWISTLPQDITVDCNDIPLPDSLEAVDNCSDVVVSFTEEIIPGNSVSEYYLSREWVASDECENSINHTQLITVTDNIPPSVTCPPAQTLNAEGMCSVTMPDFAGLVDAEDNCTPGQDIIINQIPTPGLTVTVEEVTIFMSVADQSGNTSNCSFNLSLTNFGDDVSLSCPDSVVVDADAGHCDAVVSLSASFTEDCVGVQVINDFSSNGANADGIYPLGTTQVEFQLIQDGDSVLSCVTTVSVLDVQVPEIICPEDLTLQVDTGSCTVFEPELGVAEVELACSGFEIFSNAPVEFDTGSHTVVYTAVADNGQSASCEQTISVQDNQPPSIQCPEDLEVILDTGECELTDFEAEDALAGSVCGTVDVSNDAAEILPIGTTTITQTASDVNGQVSICTHTVTVIPTEESSILCPADIELILSEGDCMVDDLNIEDPVITGTCDEFLIENDAPQTFDIGETVVTHLAISDGGAELSCSQTISVVNVESPEVICPSGLIVNTDTEACYATGVDPGEPIVSHSCLEVSWTSDLPAQLPVGITNVEYTALAQNDSTATCHTTIEVIDNEPPTIECPSDLTVEIPNGQTEVALTLDPAIGSDNCSLAELDNDFNGGENASGTYPLGLTVVTFTAEDVYGNQSSCQTQVLIFEEGAPPATVEISGNFASWAGVNINNVEVVVSGNDPGIYFSNSMGNYAFDVIQGSNVIVAPEKDYNWLDGVSVTDLVLIQRHILGIDPFSDPYQFIAADASGNGSITTFDLVTLQILIIGITSEISTNEPWLFVPASHNFDNPENPLLETWPQIKAYQGVNTNRADEDWISIKVGDVSGNAGLSGQRVLTEGVEFAIKVEKEKEGVYELVVSTADDEFLNGFQLEFEYDDYNAFLDRVDYSNNPIFVDSDIITFTDRDLNVVRMVWFNGEGSEFKSGEEMFRFVFSDVKEGADVNSLIKPSLRGSKWQPYLSSIGESDKFFKPLWVPEAETRPFELYQNKPNPFSSVTDISFELPEDQDVQIEILNTSGIVIYQKTVPGKTGLNVHQLQLGEIESGVLYLRVTAGRDSGVKKMVRLR